MDMDFELASIIEKCKKDKITKKECAYLKENWDSFDKEEKERWTKYPNASLEVFVRSEPIEFVRAMGAVHRTIPNLTPNISKMKDYGKDLDPRKNIFGKKREYELLD